MSNQLVPNRNYRITTKRLSEMVADEHKSIKLPMQSLRRFGCMFCSWRGTSLCAFKVPKGSGKPLEETFTKLGKDFEGMCDKRYFFIAGMYTGKLKIVVEDKHDFFKNDFFIGDKTDALKYKEYTNFISV